MQERTPNFTTNDLEPCGSGLLLPVPDAEDVADFIALYQKKYGIILVPDKAHEILGGLMRFLYLTRQEDEDAQSPVSE